MTLKERPLFFRWATQSDATPFWYGELYGDTVPSYTIFKHEWPAYYFSDEEPERGRCFVIEHQGQPIGEINYNQIHPPKREAELDILIASREFQGKGLGTDAIRTLVRYLFSDLQVSVCRFEAVSRNIQALQAYQKAGFAEKARFHRDEIEWVSLEHTPASGPPFPQKDTQNRPSRP